MITTTSTIITVATIRSCPCPLPSRPQPEAASGNTSTCSPTSFVGTDGGSRAGPRFGHKEADLLVSRKDFRYVVELKVAPESRRDRLVPLLAQAILQARAIAHASPQPAAPLAVIAAPLVSPSIVRSVAGISCRKRARGRSRHLRTAKAFDFLLGRDSKGLNAPPSESRSPPTARSPGVRLPLLRPEPVDAQGSARPPYPGRPASRLRARSTATLPNWPRPQRSR